MFVCVARSSRCVGSRHPILYEHPSDEVCLHSSFAVGAMSSPPAPNSSSPSQSSCATCCQRKRCTLNCAAHSGTSTTDSRRNKQNRKKPLCACRPPVKILISASECNACTGNVTRCMRGNSGDAVAPMVDVAASRLPQKTQRGQRADMADLKRTTRSPTRTHSASTNRIKQMRRNEYT